ncbi:acyltransferase [Labrys sp. WJW]|uniref:acyltransferase family protein n=1 Tax=Labrys sp. WJW TaxID=1737983 RepID=UPI0009EEF3C4|nr:acyltransferase [Labrys sp. WJW]
MRRHSMFPGSQAAKPHFLLLDGLRGFAAFCVMLIHLGSWLAVPWVARNSYLAVDLFFCLSGYVLSYAYMGQARTMDSFEFLRVRLLRLLPLTVLALAISASYLVARGAFEHAPVPYAELLNALMLSTFSLPNFSAPAEIGGPSFFPLNAPQYTILLELTANLVWWRLRHTNLEKAAAALALACLCILMVTGLGGDTPNTFLSGFPRVGASFFIGVVLYQMRDRLPAWRGWTVTFWLLAGAMAVLFFWPAELPRVVQLTWVALLSPALVAVGARVQCSGGLAAFCSAAGTVSYPLYCLHFPIFCWINGLYRSFFGAQNFYVEAPIVAVVAIIASLLAHYCYDVPIRRYLSARARRAHA